MNRTFLIFLLAFATSSNVFAQDAERAHHELYGDGMRLYAEGRYDRALEKLYRALAIEKSELLLKLIIRSHDFMGHCSAAERQMTLFQELYPRGEAPNLQICTDPGTLVIECSPHAGEVVINHTIRAACGGEIALPAGSHRLRSPQLNQEEIFEVKSGETTVAKLELNPEKWLRSESRRKTGSDSIVIQTPDGRYQIWLKSNLRRDPDMDRESPGFEIVETTGEVESRKSKVEMPSVSP